MTLEAAGSVILRQQVERMLTLENATRKGEDIEALHQMRVATRRLRAALRLFTTPESAYLLDTFEEDIKLIAAALGGVRDLDVFGVALRTYGETHAADVTALHFVLDALDAERERRREDLFAALDGPAMERIRTSFIDALTKAAEAGTQDDSVIQAAPTLIGRRLKRVRRAGRMLFAPTSAELHEMRILCKRFRYACEFFAPVYGEALADHVRAATAIQDSLGALHDSDIAASTVLELLAAHDGGSKTKRRGKQALPTALLRLVQYWQAGREEMLVAFRSQWTDLLRLGKIPVPTEAPA